MVITVSDLNETLEIARVETGDLEELESLADTAR
jgi:hypothetical protein